MRLRSPVRPKVPEHHRALGPISTAPACWDSQGQEPKMEATTRASEFSNDSPATGESGVSPPSPAHEARAKAGAVPLAAVIVIVLLMYTLFATGGMMTTVPPTTSVYGLLAESFMQGRLDLLLDPPPELAAIENPYDPAERAGIDVSTDATYFRGRYFVYWGPAPAAILAVWKAIFQRSLGDGAIAFAAAVATFLFASFLLLRLRRLYFPSLPTWLVAVSLAAVGMAHPILWNLSFPAIYEAAIGTGQAFLFGGLYLSVSVIGGSAASRRTMALIGTFWGLAIASRLTLFPAVGVLLLGTLFGLGASQRTQTPRAALLPARCSLILPLVLICSLLGLYNHLRFGKPTETGFQFQLVPDLDYPRLMAAGEMFNPRYFVPNALYYSVAPARLRASFPFAESARGGLSWERAFIGDLGPQGVYSVGNITGVLAAAPFTLFAGLLVASQIMRAFGTSSPSAPPPDKATGAPNIGAAEVGMTIVAAAALTAFSTLAYRHVTNRFELDYVPLLLIASSIGAWQLHKNYRGCRVHSALVNLLIVLTVLGTLLSGILLGASRP